MFYPTKIIQLTILGFLIAWFSLQIFMPLRHLLYPGSVSWTEEGHRFAWQMKLRDKTGRVRFRIVDPASDQEWTDFGHTDLNYRQARKMSTRPDMILQYAHMLSAKWREEKAIENLEIYVDSWSSLNGRAKQRMIDPNVNLLSLKRSLKHQQWILPLTTPFRSEIKLFDKREIEDD